MRHPQRTFAGLQSQPLSSIPDYHGASLVNLMASITEGLGGRPRHAPLRALGAQECRAAQRIVLLVIDGLGERQLRELIPDGALAASHRATIDSVFPPTTASAITTTYTGATPLEHGLTGWHVYFPDASCVAAALPMLSRGDEVPLVRRGLSAARAFSEPSLFDTLSVPAAVVTDRRIIDSGYNRHHCGSAARHAYADVGALADLTAAAAHGMRGPGLVYSYWPDFDSAAHRYGPGSAKAATRARAIDAAFARLRESLAGSDTLLIATADHGFIDTPVAHCLDLSEADGLSALLRLPLCGERRSAFCHVQPGRVLEFAARARDWLGERADVRPCGELIDEGWFGPGQAHRQFVERIGDVALLMHDDWSVKDWVRGEARYLHCGNHGGTSADELRIPLVVSAC